jgi:hypothetical protein
VVTDV